VAAPAVAKLGEFLWIVDLNRQSLDRVAPEMQIQRLLGMFVAGWQVVTLKWGRTISEVVEAARVMGDHGWSPVSSA
jgi:pyruvate dehydrogenase E1 component